MTRKSVYRIMANTEVPITAEDIELIDTAEAVDQLAETVERNQEALISIARQKVAYGNDPNSAALNFLEQNTEDFGADTPKLNAESDDPEAYTAGTLADYKANADRRKKEQQEKARERGSTGDASELPRADGEVT